MKDAVMIIENQNNFQDEEVTIMNLSYYYYKDEYPIKPNRKSNSEYSGCLLKLSNDNGLSGYTNYHALKAFNDIPAEEIIENFKLNKFTDVHHLLLQYLKQDLQFRSLQTDALAGAFQLENHFLITDVSQYDEQKLQDLVQQHFRYFKIKMGMNIEEESHWIQKNAQFFQENKVLLRPDFNEFFNFREFDSWQKEYSFHNLSIIDFYEDPTPFENESWLNWKQQGLRLAKDFQKPESVKDYEGVSVFILKPAKMNIIEWLKHLSQPNNYEYVVTHYMDTALGVAQAAACALKLKFFVGDRLLACGLMPSHLPHFKKELQWPLLSRGPHVLFNDDIGLGFSKELESIDWKPLDCQLAE